MKRLERVARQICIEMGDDPDKMAYPPMQHLQAHKQHVIYAPTQEYSIPRPCWYWYIREARAALDALKDELPPEKESNPPQMIL